jgi:hypothetical protein
LSLLVPYLVLVIVIELELDIELDIELGTCSINIFAVCC